MMSTEMMAGMRKLEYRLKAHYDKPTKDPMEQIIAVNALAVLQCEVRELEKEFDEEMDKMEVYYGQGRPIEVD